MNILRKLGLKGKPSWQALMGSRPHMLDSDFADAGFEKSRRPPVENGIAVIDIRGVLVSEEDAWDGWASTTYGRIQERVSQALDDPSVDGLVLRINSPGGESDGAFETFQAIFESRSLKPVWAVADLSAYSAAYLLACAASRIYVSEFTGGVGSIGVYSLHLDFSGALSRGGIEPTFIEAGEGKTDGHPYKPLSDRAKANLSRQVDRLYGMFLERVSESRGMTAGRLGEIGAAILPGREAIDLRLADGIGTLSQAIAAMREWIDADRSARDQRDVSAESPSAPGRSGLSEATDQDSAQAGETLPPPGDRAPDVEFPGDPVAAERLELFRRESIGALCSLAGWDAERTAQTLCSGRSPQQISAEILEQRARDQEGSSISSQLQPVTGSGAEVANTNESPIVVAAVRLALGAKTKER